MKLALAQIAPKITLVTFAQENLDAGNVKEFHDAIHEAVNASHTLLLDMACLTFVDSSGLGALLSVLRSMNGKNGQLRLFGMTRPVTALFELVRMHRLFAIFATREQALEDLAAAGTQ